MSRQQCHRDRAWGDPSGVFQREMPGLLMKLECSSRDRPCLGEHESIRPPRLKSYIKFHCSPCFSTHFFCDYSYSILEIAAIIYADSNHHHHINSYPVISGTYFLHCLTPAFWIASPTCLIEVPCVGENILSMRYEWVNQIAIVMSLSFKDITTNTW